jgi:tRNA(Ile)-lysidine synthase
MPGGVGLTDTLQSALNVRLDNWAQRFGSNFVLGLSGGGDSMALALGCAGWAGGGRGNVVAVCVDHGLRDGSGEEAQQTIAWARGLGINCEIAALQVARGQSRLQERARIGRHRALLEVAKQNNARVILLAHTQDDQFETLAMRLASKTGLEGLAGMAALSPSPFYQDEWPCLIGRPLLDVSRAHLRHALTQADKAWHEDPSNENNAFARIRARKRLQVLAEAGANIGVMDDIASCAATLRAASDDAGQNLLAVSQLQLTKQSARVSYAAIENAQPIVSERILGWLSFAIGRGLRLPEITKTARLRCAITAPNFKGATLAGARFQRRGDFLLVTPAPFRKGQEVDALQKNHDIQLRLAAISGNLDHFVTYLG